MSEESIRRHLCSALDAIVSRERARLHEAGGGSDAQASARIRAMRPLIEALRTLAEETGHVGNLAIQAVPEAAHARIELVEAGESRHALAISTDAANGRFEVEETQYFPLSGDRVSYVHRFDSAEEVLRFALEMIGTHIASQQALPEKLS